MDREDLERLSLLLKVKFTVVNINTHWELMTNAAHTL
jgi:hypothetical protein